jgi:MYXO-CTERM domain-containing protein
VGADDGLDDATISLIFGQEFGHAWLAFPWYLDASGQIRDDMLGRSDAHWSFYLHTGGSPVQGHDWVDNGDGTFTAHTHDIFEFSDLDLYLMGLLPASDVEPFFLLTDPTHCIDSALEDGSCAPHDAFAFEAETYTVTADRQDITIDQILDAEGPRIPAYGVAPTQWDVSFLLIKRPDEELPADQLQRLQQIVARSIELFDAQTRGLGHIINRTAGEMDPLPPPAGGSDSGSGDGSGDGDGDDSDPDPDPSGGSSAGAAFPGGSGSSYPHNDDDGCSCRTGAPPAAWWALAVLGLARRRRRH